MKPEKWRTEKWRTWKLEMPEQPNKMHNDNMNHPIRPLSHHIVHKHHPLCTMVTYRRIRKTLLKLVSVYAVKIVQWPE